MKTALHLILGGLLVPGTILLVVPGLLVWLYPIELPNPTLVRYWFAKVMLPVGLVLMGTATAQFVVSGRGTPAPWAPPQDLVTTGLYAYMRNPMMIGMLLMLGGEALLLASNAIGVWCAVVAPLVSAHTRFIEEPAMHAKFGDAYSTYKSNVPGWLPRFKAWTTPDQPTPSDL